MVNGGGGAGAAVGNGVFGLGGLSGGPLVLVAAPFYFSVTTTIVAIGLLISMRHLPHPSDRSVGSSG
ncbi:MAG: hypothetical protein AAFO59_12630, partial [Cyanobacteria bacterium J06607_17]